MPIRAGDTITAARLNWDSDEAILTDVDSPATALRQAWGTEQIVFTDPGIAVKVSAHLTGRLVSSTDNAVANVYVMISFDGGASFTEGVSAQLNTSSDGTTFRASCAAQHFRAGTPTGDIVIKAEYDPSDTTVTARSGHLTAQLVPQ